MGRKLYAKGEGFNPTTSIEDVEGLREELDALKGGSGGGGDNTTIERRLTTAEGEIDDLQRDVAAVGAKVNTLQGTDEGKSVRTIAAEETAKIVGNAPANYDTLKEIADYIASDAMGAAELNNKVNKNAADIAKVADDLEETHLLASNAESAISEVVELTIPAIESEVAKKASKTEAQGYATTAKSEAIAAAATDAQNKANTAESNAKTYADGKVKGLADGQVATNTTAIASLQAAQSSTAATVKSQGTTLSTHTQQIANLDSNKLGKTEKASDSAKADYATSAGSATNATNASQLGGVAASGYAQLSGARFTGDSSVQGVFRANAAADHRNCLAILAEIATGVNQGIAHIGTNYGFSNMSTSFTQNIIYAMSVYRGMVGIGRLFTYAELYDAYKDGRPLTVDGKAVITGTLTAAATYHSSDERLKTFDGDVEVDLEKLKALPKKYFHWTADADGKRQLGTSAQAVEKLFPELVSTNSDGYKSVNYANLSIVALAAVDKLAEQNAELERRMAKIEKLLKIE